AAPLRQRRRCYPQSRRDGAAGSEAAVRTRLGWLTVCPALGPPVPVTAATVNPAIFGVIDPKSWVGWVIMIAALVVAIAGLTAWSLRRQVSVRNQVSERLRQGRRSPP